MAVSFAVALLDWFDKAGRKHLPWQQQPTPYRVWVSEIMLQQTQVVTVIAYYQRFMERFPTVEALAAAPLDEVLHLWTGLGYYARARNLHRAATLLVQNSAGVFPDTLAEVQSLPGIGRSTASAILALSRQQRHPILDGNVKRVLSRYFGVAGFSGEKQIESQLWVHSENCLPNARIRDYTQAIMDLGATLCVRSRPQCSACPLTASCVARIEQRQHLLPTRKPKRVRPQRKAYVVVAMNRSGAVLLERRPPMGIWGGLWTFPQFDNQDGAQMFSGGPLGSSRLLPAYHHAFTHFDLELQPLLVNQFDHKQVADADRYCWYDPQNPARIGLATPVLNIIRQVTSCPAA
ncbi:MAG: A/G-specific adenine glycosylase [Candidatus Obscuribacterales bacterium]|nr:A/G-specific adenine glycosylase [Steroidobacteraceae bacterium]